ncbi:MAG: tetratricopeptide repeat protein, partial [Gemmatimonadota bacterium]|nr:tetratricopeptide repeat protein [Gemmatimonadota bacterium]
ASIPEIIELPEAAPVSANGHLVDEPVLPSDDVRSLDDQMLADAAMLPEPDWDVPIPLISDHNDDGEEQAPVAEEEPITPRDSGLHLLREQSAFLTPVVNPAIEILRDSRRPNEMTGDLDLDAMPELMDAGEIDEIPRVATGETDVIAHAGDLEAIAQATASLIEHLPDPPTLESQSEDPPQLLHVRDRIDSLYGVEEKAEQPAPEREPEPDDTPSGSDNALVFIVDELDQARERVATGGHQAIASPQADERSSVERLRERVEQEPENWSLRHELAGALADAGENGEALRILTGALAGFERAADYALARAAARDITGLQPDALAHHQKHVEMAVRANERGALLVAAYAGLADCLLRLGLKDKARAIYSRIFDLAPDHERAREMLGSLPVPANGSPYVTGVMFAIPAPPKPDPMRPPTPVASPAQSRGSDDRFVNLSDWLRDDESPKSTRMVTGAPDPTAAANSDFADMLNKFKEGVAANVEDSDHESHYDLGVAYKEMGLLDEAIAEFQKALRSTENRVRTYEALGQCFVEKKQHQIAVTILSRALDDTSTSDEKLIGVLYLLGEACESLGRRAEAATYLSRVVAVDIQFRDASTRLAAVERTIS